MHKRAENLCRVLTEYRKYSEYLESLLDRHPGGVDFRTSRPSIPDGLMSSSIELDDADFAMEREEDEGLSEASDDPTKIIRYPTTGLTVCLSHLIPMANMSHSYSAVRRRRSCTSLWNCFPLLLQQIGAVD